MIFREIDIAAQLDELARDCAEWTPGQRWLREQLTTLSCMAERMHNRALTPGELEVITAFERAEIVRSITVAEGELAVLRERLDEFDHGPGSKITVDLDG